MALLLSFTTAVGQEVRGEDTVGKEVCGGDSARAASQLRVSLLLSEPGDQYFYSIFGHAALRFQTPDMDADYTFTYVGEQLDDGAFARYMRGALKMGLAVSPTEDYIAHEQARRMYEYPLALPDSLARALLTICGREVQAGFKKQYDPITGSCSHKIALYLNEAAGVVGQNIVYSDWGEDYELSVRELCARYTEAFPWAQWLYATLPGSRVDTRQISRMAHLMYPAQLLRLWRGATIEGMPLLNGERTLMVEGEPMGEQTPVTPLMVAIVLLVLAVLSLGRWMGQRWMQWLNVPLLVVIGVVGSVLWYMWLLTDLPYTDWNWLIVPMNPLIIAFWRWRRYWGIPYALVLCALLIYTVVSPYAVMLPAWQVVTAAVMIAVGNGTPKGLWKMEN